MFLRNGGRVVDLQPGHPVLRLGHHEEEQLEHLRSQRRRHAARPAGDPHHTATSTLYILIPEGQQGPLW